MLKVAAGLFLFTKDPHKGLVAVLSKRGTFDYEKFRPEKYQNLYEATAGGGINSGEHLIEGLLREIEEELGTATAKLIRHYAAKFQNVSYTEDQKAVYTYAVYIPHFPLKILKPHRSSAGILLVSAKDIVKLKPFPKNNDRRGPSQDDDTQWMFPDQLEGLKKGFQIFGQSPLPNQHAKSKMSKPPKPALDKPVRIPVKTK
ncbi:MAG: NUDIX domain-containing protein [bacterium]|nr:NUDIX domain-containing protein [bacterium]